MKNDIAEKIKNLRTAKKITQSELAERVGITKATISAYENGTRLPSYDVLIKIAQLFHVSLDNILGYSNKYVIDVTGLDQKQRNTIHEVVSTYRRHNFLYKQITNSEDIEDELKRLDFIDKLEDEL